MQLSDNTILITGGASGIGRALAEAFHMRGNTVIVIGRRAEALEELRARAPGIHTRVLDITNLRAVEAGVKRVLHDFPSLNVLVNNAGIMQAEDLLAPRIDLLVLEATIATNLLAPMRLTALLLAHLRRQQRAAIVNVSSGLAFVPRADTPSYSASKAALHSYSESLRFQLRGTSVQVHELVPPYVQTELMGERQAADPTAMPLEAFIHETLLLLESDPDIEEICVDRVLPLRNAAGSSDYRGFFRDFNERLQAARVTN